jgi:integrase
LRRFYYHTRHNGIIYAELVDPNSGKKLTARSTGTQNKDDALLVIGEWLKNGIPTGRTRKPRPVDIAASVEGILTAIRKADLNEDDALLIVEALQSRGLVDYSVQKTSKASVLFEDYLEKFWDFSVSPYVREKLAHGQSIGKRHCYESANRIRGYWVPFFQGRTLESISRKDLKSFSIALSDKGLAASSINRILVAGTTALSWAFREGDISSDPTDGLTRFSGEKKRRGVLTPEEAVALLDCEWLDERARIGNFLAMTTGLRSGEVLAIRRSDIGDDKLYVRHSWSTFDGLKKPKTNKVRIVALLPEVKSELLYLLNQNPHQVADPYVFYGLHEDKPMVQNILLDGLKDALIKLSSGGNSQPDEAERANILKMWTNRGVVFHSWRHFYSARMADKLEARKVMRATGHATEAVFADYADHALDSDFEELYNVTSEVFGSIVASRKSA